MSRHNNWAGQLSAMLLVVAAVASFGCTTSPQVKKAKFLKRGAAYMASKDYSRAVLEFFNAARLDPKDAEVLYQLGLAKWGAGQYSEAYLALRTAADLNPQHIRAQAKLAELMATSWDEKLAAEAKQHAEEAANIAPKNPDALYALALTQYRLGETANAETELQKTLADSPKSLRSSVALATIYLASKNYQAAEEVLQAAVRQTPESARALLALADAYELDDKIEQAENEYKQALDITPNNGIALFHIANLQLKSGRKNEAEQTFRKLATTPDKAYQASYAFFLMDQGRASEAITEFRRLADNDGSDRLARSRLVTAYMSLNKLDDAQNILAEALKKNPKDTAALFQRSEVYIRLHRYEEAEHDLTDVLHWDRTRAEPHYLLSEVYKARGAELLERQELNEALRYRPDLLDARIALAHGLVASHNSKEAVGLLNQAPEDQKQMTALITARNWALLASRQEEEARKGVETGMARGKTPELALQAALLKIREKDYDHARTLLEGVLRADPANTPALKVLAQTYIDQNQPAVASQKVRQYAIIGRGSVDLQVFAADWFLKHGNPSEAADAITAAKADDPKGPVPELLQAQLEWRQGKADSARSRLTGILARNDRNMPAHLLLAMIEENAGNTSQAIIHYRRTVELDSRQTVALNGLAYNLGNTTDQLDEALKLAQQAKELEPANPAIDDTLGWILFRRGAYRQARDHLENASAKSPDPVIKYHLAMACFRLGEVDRGRKILRAALEANPKLPEAAQALMAAALR